MGEVYRVDLEDGRRVVAKVDGRASAALSIEGRMLTYLRAHSRLPVPEVFLASDSLLVMEYVPGGPSATTETHAANLLAELHQVRADRFGLDFDTLIGGLPQENGWCASWVEFFRRRRLLAMARAAEAEGCLGEPLRVRLEALAHDLEQHLEEPQHPSLLHGDVWSGNVIPGGEGVAAFVDPAIYYGHPEIELAFITMFSTFGEAFFRTYRERREIRPGFFEVRRHLYNLYPLLVHVRLFGGGYLSGVEGTLERLGY